MGSDVDTASRYYDKLYSGVREGYARLEDFWEIPQWIGQIANTIPNTDVYVVRDMQAAKNFLATSGYDHVAFSSLDVTIPLIKELAPSFPGDVSIGGYANKEAFKDVNHKWYDSIEEMAKDYGHPYVQGTDYTHFKGKQLFLLTTYGGEDPNSGPRLCEQSFRDICEFLDMQFRDCIGVCSGMTPVRDNKRALERAFLAGASI